MSKYFKTGEEFDEWIHNRFFKMEKVEDILNFYDPTAEEMIEALIEDGYTDLNNLVEDGHGYQIGEYTNDGWIYEDEADIEYIKSHGIKRELRKR